MKLLYFPLRVLYRIWFYILVAVAIVLLFPLLLISVSKERWYSFFFSLARVWSKFILIGMGLYWRIKRQAVLEKKQSYIFIANHTSMIDIMLMFVCIREHPFVFVGKKELAKLPIFGFFYKKTSILVDRDSAKSRGAVFQSAQKRIDNGLSLCIFPEGRVPDETILLDTFKDGAFRMAIKHQLQIVPLTFYDNKKRFSYKLFSGKPGLLRAVMHEPIATYGLSVKDAEVLKLKARNIILSDLEKDAQHEA